MANDIELAITAWLSTETEPVAWVGVDGRYRAVSAAFAELINRRPDEVVGHLRSEFTDDAEQAVLETSGAPLPGRPELLYVSLPLPGASALGWRDELRGDAKNASTRRDQQLMARISHELRTPMTALLGYCQVLLAYGGPLSASQETMVQHICKNATDLSQLFNNLLDASKIYDGRMTVTYESVDPQTLVDDVISVVKPQMFAKNLAITTNVDSDLPDFYTDRIKAKQILVNLVSNAVNYTEEGRVTIDMRVVDGHVVCVVGDTGPGIPADSLETIFKPYEQVRVPGQVVRHASTGLGLTVARGLATLLGGRLTVESQVGVGSAFTLALPLRLTRPAKSG